MKASFMEPKDEKKKKIRALHNKVKSELENPANGLNKRLEGMRNCVIDMAHYDGQWFIFLADAFTVFFKQSEEWINKFNNAPLTDKGLMLMDLKELEDVDEIMRRASSFGRVLENTSIYRNDPRYQHANFRLFYTLSGDPYYLYLMNSCFYIYPKKVAESNSNHEGMFF